MSRRLAFLAVPDPVKDQQQANQGWFARRDGMRKVLAAKFGTP